ncbi:MAG TPA: hypothetical protein VFT69_18250, partial [Pseudolabrys sp.]|nr:hypothetical protein [Pseudolabrys sp.]
PLTDRVWTINRDGSGSRRVYEREDRMQWVTHEVWVPGRRAVAFVDWPRGMRLIQIDSGKIAWLHHFPAWHAAPDDAGKRFVCDTNFPDTGLHVVPCNGEPIYVCASDASSEGAHWAGPFPYNDGPVEVKARQHTHPHPRFSPDGSRIVFTSDRTGFSQVYEVELDGAAA